MADLSDEMKSHIVVELARFRAPSRIRDELRKEYGLEVPMDQIVRYNPTKACFDSGEKWKSLFDAARKAYCEEVTTIPIASQAFRLNELLDLYHDARKGGNTVLAAKLLEQAAQEAGGAFTNERKLEVTEVTALDPEERRQEFERIIALALGKQAPGGTETRQ